MQSFQSKNIAPTNFHHSPFQRENSKPFFGKNHNPFFKVSPVQPKLTVNQPGDIYEKEADAMADKVVQRPSEPASIQTKSFSSSGAVTPIVQKKCAHCEEEEKLQKKEDETVKEQIQKKPIFKSDAEPQDDEKNIQRKCAECEKEEKSQKKTDNSSSRSASPNIESRLSSSKDSGAQLPAETRQHMEHSFGADFSNVRIHNNSSAVQLSKDLNAQAFTHGSDIYFNSGKYDLNSKGGKHLLAHELTHVVQQGNNNIQKTNEKNVQKQSFLNIGGNKVQRFNIPWTNYETDISWSGFKTAAGLTADAAKATGKWVYNRGKFIVGNAYDCAKATGSSIGKLVTGDFDSLADLLGMPKPGEDGPTMTDFISFVITHPCLKMIPGYEAVEYTVDKFSGVSKFLKGAWHMAKNPDETIEAIHTSPFLTGIVGGISPATLAIAMKAVTFSTPSAEIVKGIYRHLIPKLDYLANNWWDVLKSAAWDLIWPWPGVGKDLGVIWDQLGKCVDNLWNLNISNAADNLLTIWRTVNGMLGRLYGWFLIASVLIGAIIGAFFGGAGAIPGALLGFEFAMSVGQGLLISTIAAETATIGKAGLDVVFKNLTPEEKENNFEKIANSGITLAITGVMVALGELAVRFAKGLIDKISGLFISAEEGVGATSGGIGKGGGSSGSNSQGGQSWTPRVIQGGKGAAPSTGPVAQGGSSGGTIGNTAVKIEPAPIIEPPPKPNLKIVPDLPPAAKTPSLPTNTGPVIGGVAGVEAAKKLKEKTKCPSNSFPDPEAPTGLSPTDPIRITWYKPVSLYPDPIDIGGFDYFMEKITKLPFGEPIGVKSDFFPFIGKKMQLRFEEDRGNEAIFRDVLERHGFNWNNYNGRSYSPDHLQDVMWSGIDDFSNLWPLEREYNREAGRIQNQHQKILFRPDPKSPCAVYVTIQTGRNAYGAEDRFYIITNIESI